MHKTLLIFFACALLSCAQTAPHADQWLGKWTGPEGTSLTINKIDNQYNVAIQSLDDLKTYPAIVKDDRLTFIRDGRHETISAGNGEVTGMKWLLDKKNCLVIKIGEGFCRD